MMGNLPPKHRRVYAQLRAFWKFGFRSDHAGNFITTLLIVQEHQLRVALPECVRA
jgi:hypothetical protein